MTTSMRRFVADDPVEVLQHPHAEASRARDDNNLKEWWLHGEGAGKWSTWTELYGHLKDHMADERAKRVAAEWFHERYGIWPGHQRGENPRGPG